RACNVIYAGCTAGEPTGRLTAAARLHRYCCASARRLITAKLPGPGPATSNAGQAVRRWQRRPRGGRCQRPTEKIDAIAPRMDSFALPRNCLPCTSKQSVAAVEELKLLDTRRIACI